MDYDEKSIEKAIRLAMANQSEDMTMNHTAKVYMLCLTTLTMNTKISKRDKDMILTAVWLHDLIEDTPITYTQILVQFGKEVADLVWEVTKTKDNTFPNLKTKYGYIIKFCDRTVNLLNRIKDDNKLAKSDKYFMKSIFWKVE